VADGGVADAGSGLASGGVAWHGPGVPSGTAVLAREGTSLVLDSAPALPGAGHGIIGMRERVSLLGGEFSAGPLPGYGFRVTARIPLPAASA
jgi:hypothetical protein